MPRTTIDLDAAVLAARNFPGVTILRDAAAALADLILDTLPIGADLLDIFAAWGIRTLGDLAALPDTGLAERMGRRAVERRGAYLPAAMRAASRANRWLMPRSRSRISITSGRASNPTRFRASTARLSARVKVAKRSAGVGRLGTSKC